MPAPKRPGEFWVINRDAGRDTPATTAVNRAAALLEEIGLLKSVHFASPSSLDVLALCEDVALRIQTSARDLLKERADAKGGKLAALDDRARSLTRYVYQIRAWLRFVVSSDNAAPVADIVAPLESLVEKHAKGVKTLVRPQWKYNFSHRNLARLLYTAGHHSFDWTTADFSKIAKNHGFNAQRGMPHIAVLSYAGIERRNALALVMLAHEIGHLLDEHYGLTSARDVRTTLSQSTEQHRKKEAGSPQKKENLAASVDELSKEAGFWIKEIVADVAALRLVGPAYICALKASAYALATYKKLPHEHPPLEDRLKWLLAESESSDLGHMKFLKEHAKDDATAAIMRDYLLSQATDPGVAESDAGTSQASQEESKKTEHLRRLSQAATEKALAKLREHLPEAECYKLADDVFRMVDLLACEVPPCQSYVLGLDPEADRVRAPLAQQHFSLAAILNAGWMFYLSRVRRDRPTTLRDAEGRELDDETIELQRISDLMILAVKQSSFLETYACRKKKAGNGG